jgi:histone deacetylase complex regulatory component SIN3
MTAEQVFKCLSLYTAGLFERNAVMERMVGHLASHSNIPYDELEACANINFK